MWQDAQVVVKVVPGMAQLPVRARALAEGKLLYMAVPKLAGAEPFVLLDPARLTVAFDDAAASRAALSIGQLVGVDHIRPVDLVVCAAW